MIRATKVRIYPTPEQVVFLNAQFGAVRFAYNKGLHLCRHFYHRYGATLKPKHDIKPLLAIAKKSRKYHWLGQFDSIALQQAVINLDKAYTNFFNKSLNAKKPTFKNKHGYQSSYHCTGLKITANSIKIPKLSPITAKIHRDITGKVSSITVSRSATGKYYASILCDDGIAAPDKPSVIERSVGLDLGLTHFVIQSNGKKTANPRYLKNASRNLRRKQKALSRKKKGSANRKKARLQVAACHERVANKRADFQHKLSNAIVVENQAIMTETLLPRNMLKNRKLARHIADAAWSGFVEKLKYKAEAAGVHLVKIDQWYPSSKTCHCCKHKLDELPLKIRFWTCPTCLSVNDRDINAAKNVHDKGLTDLIAAGLVVSAYRGLRNSVISAVAACEVGSLVR